MSVIFYPTLAEPIVQPAAAMPSVAAWGSALSMPGIVRAFAAGRLPALTAPVPAETVFEAGWHLPLATPARIPFAVALRAASVTSPQDISVLPPPGAWLPHPALPLPRRRSVGAEAARIEMVWAPPATQVAQGWLVEFPGPRKAVRRDRGVVAGPIEWRNVPAAFLPAEPQYCIAFGSVTRTVTFAEIGRGVAFGAMDRSS